ncbi:MAG TPA: galactokinase [Kofleriaceae bacterium]|jgi:galactokinase|nr:galactokinase [Kofleriaceae bacterium]
MTFASAPGRVNLIGEHTDYNAGLVLPAVIPQRTLVELRPRRDDQIVVWSREIGAWATYRLGHERRRRDWLDYVMGCTAMLRDAGHRIAGSELRIASQVPLGGGLSSSAALEVAVLRALRTAYDLPIDDVELALIGQRAEARFVGVPVGAMDQLAASLGRLGSALFIDLRSLEIHLLALPAVDLVVIGSGLRHDHAAGDYRTRRAECEDAARRLGVRTLREVGIADLPAIAALPPPLDRRARHVVTENARVRAAVHAIETSDLRALGEQLAAGHASMRDDFEASLPEIDRLVAIAGADPAIWGARITGGGFGGAIVALAKRSQAAAAAARIAAGYLAETGIRPHILVPGGA